MKGLIYTIILAMILSVLIGCKAKTVYVPVESTKTEYRDRLERDSIYIKDSIIINKAGDSIIVEKYKYIFIDKLVRDTICKTDSIVIPYPVIEVIEVNKLKRWQIILMCLGGILVVYLGFKTYNIFR